ncbi:unnamed protein product [Dicrocoelium dendriticum]|nr:unnamed protein product [Dicrocoelium dendriticum]
MTSNIIILAMFMVAVQTIQDNQQDFSICDNKCKQYDDISDAACKNEPGARYCTEWLNVFYDCFHGCADEVLDMKNGVIRKKTRRMGVNSKKRHFAF